MDIYTVLACYWEDGNVEFKNFRDGLTAIDYAERTTSFHKAIITSSFKDKDDVEKTKKNIENAQYGFAIFEAESSEVTIVVEKNGLV